MSINIEACIKNAANSIDESSGEHTFEEVKTRSLVSIANSLLAITATLGERTKTDQNGVETCTIECNESGCNFAYRLWTLSCGHTVWTMDDAPNYCPSCGRKVER